MSPEMCADAMPSNTVRLNRQTRAMAHSQGLRGVFNRFSSAKRMHLFYLPHTHLLYAYYCFSPWCQLVIELPPLILPVSSGYRFVSVFLVKNEENTSCNDDICIFFKLTVANFIFFNMCINIHGPQRINFSDIGEPQNFYLSPLTGQIVSKSKL